MALQGCIFEPNGENFKEVDSTPKEPNIVINLNVASDTIYVCRDEFIKFWYSLDSDTVNWTQFKLNGKETEYMLDRSGGITLSFYLKDLSKGTYPLEMNIFTHSGTGSVADKAGKEGFLLTKKWTLLVTDEAKLVPQVTKLDFVDGALKIEWQQFKGVGFQKYTLIKELPYAAGKRITLATIDSPEQTSFIDNTYHGELSRYNIFVNNTISYNWKTIEGPLPVFTSYNTKDGGIVLKWNKPPFFNNLKGYNLSYSDNPGGPLIPLTKMVSTFVDSLVVPSPLFPYDYDFFLTMVPNSDCYYTDWDLRQFLSSKVKATYGIPSPVYNISIGGTSDLCYLYGWADKIHVYDRQKAAEINTITVDPNYTRLDVSNNDKYMVIKPNTPESQIRFYDLKEPVNNKLLDLKSQFPLMGHIPTVSDAGTGTFINDKSIVLYDFINEQKLDEIAFDDNGLYSSKISPSGRFFFCETYNNYFYFAYKDGNLSLLSKTTNFIEFTMFAEYLPGTAEKLVRAFKNRVEILDCNTWVVEKQWMFDSPIKDIYNLEMKSQKLFLRVGNDLISFDINNGGKEVLAITGNSPYLSKWDLFYTGRQILWSKGRTLDLTNN